MAQTLTAKGGVRSGAVAASITLSSVSLDAGRTAIIFVAGKVNADPISVVWGSGSNAQNAEKIASIYNATSGITLTAWTLRYVLFTGTQDIVATYTATNSERAIICEQITEGTVVDVSSTATQNASTTPNTGTAVTSLTANTIQVACLCSDGRTSDVAGTLGEGHTFSQEVSTNPEGVAMYTSYEVLTTTGDVRAAKTGVTSRNWCNIILALKKRQTFTIKSMQQYNRYQNHLPDYVWVLIEDEAGNGFEIPIDPVVFDSYTDTEVINYLRRICAIYASNNLDDELIIAPDTSRNTRMATFVNDEIVL